MDRVEGIPALGACGPRWGPSEAVAELVALRVAFVRLARWR